MFIILLEIINQNSDYFDKLIIIDENKFIANNKIKLAIIPKTLTDISIQITTIATGKAVFHCNKFMLYKNSIHNSVNYRLLHQHICHLFVVTAPCVAIPCHNSTEGILSQSIIN